MTTRKRLTERLTIPHECGALADRRLEGFLRACSVEENVLKTLMRSCYLQGVYDGAQVAAQRPELIALFQGAGHD